MTMHPRQDPGPGYYPAPGYPGWVDYWDGRAWAGRPVQAQPAQPQVIVVGSGGAPMHGHVSGLTTGGHLMHAMLTLFTAGLWLPVWIWRAVMGRRAIR